MRVGFPAIVVMLLIGVFAYWWFGGDEWAIVNQPPPPGAIVAFGDSLTAGTGAKPGRSYPEQLADLLRRPVINAGVPGDTIGEAAERLESDVLTHDPGLVLVLLGGNDLLQRRDLDQSFATFKRLIKRIQEDGAMVVLIGIKGFSPIARLGGRYRRLARQTGCLYIPAILDGILTERSLMADQIHPNGQGYAIVARRIFEAIRPYLPERSPRSDRGNRAAGWDICLDILERIAETRYRGSL